VCTRTDLDTHPTAAEDTDGRGGEGARGSHVDGAHVDGAHVDGARGPHWADGAQVPLEKHARHRDVDAMRKVPVQTLVQRLRWLVVGKPGRV
jgi:hypothetical protein